MTSHRESLTLKPPPSDVPPGPIVGPPILGDGTEAPPGESGKAVKPLHEHKTVYIDTRNH